MFTRRRLFVSATATLIYAVAMTTAHAQAAPTMKMAKDVAAPSKGKEGIVKLSDSSIQYFSRGKGEAIVLLPAAH